MYLSYLTNLLTHILFSFKLTDLLSDTCTNIYLNEIMFLAEECNVFVIVIARVNADPDCTYYLNFLYENRIISCKD